MRIIGGKYGGRKLVSFKASHIRPTTDRVKEVIFNKLQFDMEGADVLDLFSGTGSLAFEALSRGANKVQAVEFSKASVQVIEKNRKLLSVGAELQVAPSDVFKFLKHHEEKYDIVLVDPPFTKKIADEALQALAQSHCLKQGSEVFIESTSQETVQDSYGPLLLKKRQSFGDKFLSHYIFG